MMAGGAWTWNRLFPAMPFAFDVTTACLDACQRSNVLEVLLTLWGDDGAECDYLSALPVIAYFAEHCWTRRDVFAPSRSPRVLPLEPDPSVCRARAARLFSALTDGARMELFMLAGTVDGVPGYDLCWGNVSKQMLWDDPLLGLCAGNMGEDLRTRLAGHWRALARRLESALQSADARPFELRLQVPLLLSRICASKVQLRAQLVAAHAAQDRQALQSLRDGTIATLISDVGRLQSIHRQLWMTVSRPFGWEVLEHRYASAHSRLRTAQDRITDLLEGRDSVLEELQARVMPLSSQTPDRLTLTWSRLASGCATYLGGG